MKDFLKWGALLCALLLLFSCASAEADGELLENGGFERLDGNGNPTGWYESAYRTQAGYTRISVTDESAHSGSHSAKIVNANQNDARYVCTLSVEPNTMYRVSGYVLVEEMAAEGNGANFAVEGLYSFSEGLYDTGGEWRYLEWYGETDEQQTSVQLGVRVGGYGAESAGTAYFDDLSVVKVDTLPDGVIADLWYTPTAISYNAATEAEEPQKSTAWFVALAALFVIMALLGRRYGLRGGNARGATLIFVAGLLAAMVLRVVIAVTVPGYSVDMSCFAAWSMRMASVGPAGFYETGYFCDYPPGMLLLLWPAGLLLNAVGYANQGNVWLIVKLLPLLADAAIAVLLFAYARKRLPGYAAATVALLFAFNPAALCNGAAWGQTDAVLALLLLLTAVYAMERKWRYALPLYVVAVLTKPQALLFAPLGVAWLVASLLRHKGAKASEPGKDALIGLGASLVAAALMIVPFSIRQSDPLWLVARYQETLSSYAYACLNTANLCYLLGGNWSPLAISEGARVLPFWLPLATGLALSAFGAWRLKLHTSLGTLRARVAGLGQDQRGARELALCGLCFALGLAFLVECFWPCTYQSYGVTWMIAAYLWGMLCVALDPDAKRLPFYLALTLIGVYVLGIKIHERYLFVALPLLLLAYATTRDRRMLWLCVGFSVTTFLNTAVVLDNSILYGASMGHLNDDTIVLNDALCVANLLLCGFAGYLSLTGPKESAVIVDGQGANEAPRPPAVYVNALLTPADARLRLGRMDWLAMLLTTLVYAVVAFTNLGSTKAPQTGWVATSPDEQVVFELSERQMFSVLYYGGVSYNDFSISVSEDGENWSDPIACNMNEGLCYCWHYVIASITEGGEITFRANTPENVVWLTGRYLRLNAESAGLNLWELVVRNEAGENVPLTMVAHTGAKESLNLGKPAENLIDEQDTLTGEPSWFNGTYFDEIYYARTAYEHLNGTAPYETTHPPLGKLMIAAGVALFGMTPFGWRFAGTLVGVLMLPALYLLAKQITRRRDLALFSMLLLALDLMHFTQTRIATIDTYPVFFIILSYLCMARYLMSDHFAVPTGENRARVLTRPFLRTLTPLALCGFFMGLGIASKWTGLYSAVGLALLFLVSMYRQLRAGNVAFELEIGKGTNLTGAQRARVQAARELTIKRSLATCGFCVLFFIAVPAVIYYLCYIPYLSPTGPVTLARIFRTQESMLAYHSTPGLGQDHPFNSPWWQWPFILKPIWYVQDKFEPLGYASTIMCMGNPAVFYVGAVCMALCAGLFVRRHLAARNGRLPVVRGDGDLRPVVLLVGFLAQYLPWVLVPRSMYFYHYFASVPFIILATAMIFDSVRKPKLRHALMAAFVGVAAVFFAMFYPYASGLLTPTAWLDWLKWFPHIYY